MNNLALTFEQYEVRLAMVDGEPWWVLADVCAVLEIENPRNAAARLDDDEKGVHSMDTLGGSQEMIIVSEPGLYKLLMTSRKPEARRFDRWVRHEVLPEIRRTGSYHGEPATHRDLIQSIREIVAPLAIRFDGQDVAIERVEARVDAIAEDVGSIKLRLFDSRKRISPTVRAEHVDAIKRLGGRCPSCGLAEVIMNGEKSPFAEFDHFYQNSRADADHTWLICKPCHTDLTNGRVTRDQREAAFRAYQDKRRRLPGRQTKLL